MAAFMSAVTARMDAAEQRAEAAEARTDAVQRQLADLQQVGSTVGLLGQVCRGPVLIII